MNKSIEQRQDSSGVQILAAEIKLVDVFPPIMIRQISDSHFVPQSTQSKTNDSSLLNPVVKRGKEQKFFAGSCLLNKRARLFNCDRQMLCELFQVIARVGTTLANRIV